MLPGQLGQRGELRRPCSYLSNRGYTLTHCWSWMTLELYVATNSTHSCYIQRPSDLKSLLQEGKLPLQMANQNNNKSLWETHLPKGLLPEERRKIFSSSCWLFKKIKEFEQIKFLLILFRLLYTHKFKPLFDLIAWRRWLEVYVSKEREKLFWIKFCSSLCFHIASLSFSKKIEEQWRDTTLQK